MRESFYSQCFERDGRYFIFNAERVLFAEVEQDLYIKLFNKDYDDIPEDVLKQLIDADYLSEDDTQDSNFFNEENIKFLTNSFNPRVLYLILVPTTSCNFKCPYCFEGEKVNATMSDEIQDKVIEHIKSYKNLEQLNITWYGGEPLLAFDVIKSLYAKIAELEIPIGTHDIITNGYLINDEVVEFFKTAKINGVQITLDGTQPNHDKTRCLRNDTPTFSKIINNIHLLSSNLPGLNISIRVNIDRNNIDDFQEMFRYIHGEFTSDKIYVYPGIIQTEKKDGCSMCYNYITNNDKFNLYKQLREQGINIQFMPKKPKHRGCMINNINSFIIGPRGELYKCWNDVNHPEKIVGNLNTPDVLNSRLLSEYTLYSHQFNSSGCRQCKVFPICKGGCGWHRMRNNLKGTTFELCSPYKNQEILKEALVLSITPSSPDIQQPLYL
ncbi:MAG: radical SAM protein [Muribaculaceae bacterium]|nr:radical SAM protein [Muribaculaceae bacterium]